MVTWVIEHAFSNVDFETMCSHIAAKGLPLHVVKIVPFVHTLEEGTSPPVVDGPCVVYGSVGVKALAEQQGWQPGVFGNPNDLTETEANKALGELYLNHGQMVTPIKRLGANPQAFANLLTPLHDPPLESFFIKPNADTKEFAGQVIKVAEFSKWYSGMVESGYLDDNDFNVVVSRPKKLGCEWRIFMVDGKISAYSLYRQYQTVMPERMILPEVEELVLTADKLFRPAPVYVIDVAQVYLTTGEVEFRVIEYNTANSAGFYACDIPKIIDDITGYVSNV